MRDQRIDINHEKPRMTRIIIIAVVAALLSWLLHSLGISFPSFIFPTFIGPML